MAADLNILRPVQNGKVANCQWANIKFVQVQLSLDFAMLVNVAEPAGPMTLQMEYNLELPQTTQAMTN